MKPTLARQTWLVAAAAVTSLVANLLALAVPIYTLQDLNPDLALHLWRHVLLGSGGFVW